MWRVIELKEVLHMLRALIRQYLILKSCFWGLEQGLIMKENQYLDFYSLYYWFSEPLNPENKYLVYCLLAAFVVHTIKGCSEL